MLSSNPLEKVQKFTFTHSNTVKVKKHHFSVTSPLITFLREFFCSFFNRFENSIKFCVFLYPYCLCDEFFVYHAYEHFLQTLKAKADETAEKRAGRTKLLNHCTLLHIIYSYCSRKRWRVCIFF